MARACSLAVRAVAACAVLAYLGLGKRVAVSWDIGYVADTRAGHTLRRAIGANGMLPIPPVAATVGDTLELTVHNSLDTTTTIHAHGLFQRNATYMDGPAMATQCGIPPGASFTYVYELDNAGTFWLHGHDHHQNSDGLRAPMIVHDKPGTEPFAYDQDILLPVEDWFHDEFADRIKQTIDPNATFPPPHGYASGLINGTDGDSTRPLRFEPGRTYRLRLINMSALMWFQFSLPGHKLEVIEIDGEYTAPLSVDGIDIGPAQRYSVLVSAYPTVAANFVYNVTMHANFIPPTAGLTPRTYIGQVVYREGAPRAATIAPAHGSPDFQWLHDIELQPLDGQPALVPDRRISLEVGNLVYSTGQHLDHINNITYTAPKVPTLLTALSMGAAAADPRVYGPQTNAVVLAHNEVVELTVNNPGDLPHPLHLHGHTFQIIEVGPAMTQLKIPEEYQSTTVRCAGPFPPRRDTAVVPEYSYIKIRFRADNPGVWFFHCHMDIHFAMGMAMVFVEAPDILQQTLRVPQEMLDFCRARDIPIAGNAIGKSGLDFSGAPAVPTVVEPQPLKHPN
ncbi:ferroxidase fet3 [Coemansia nantahalensis]|uniref:Ferroxidase fet3 n=1 Tax=Coemansia nantahalensis TaxID=2789366 RepID=A0ACC1JZX3_9FUNG|nr:ferroxidase fet3 [Coemansia nantahalensis]KAJ2775020.1 ferroxidase fet3 [Coemansia nantahalensis]